MKRPSAETKAAILADYTAGMSTTAVARKYGVSSNTAHRYVHQAGIARSLRGAKAVERAKRQAAYDREHGLSDGHWTPNRRGVLVWQPCFFNNAQTCNLNHQENPNAA